MLINSPVITVSGTAHTLERTSMGDGRGAFKKAAAGLKLSVSNSYGKRNSVVARLDLDKIVPDPLLTGVSKPISGSAYLVINTPSVGFTPTEIEGLAKGLVDYLAAAGILTKIINGEA